SAASSRAPRVSRAGADLARDACMKTRMMRALRDAAKLGRLKPDAFGEPSVARDLVEGRLLFDVKVLAGDVVERRIEREPNDGTRAVLGRLPERLHGPEDEPER